MSSATAIRLWYRLNLFWKAATFREGDIRPNLAIRNTVGGLVSDWPDTFLKGKDAGLSSALEHLAPTERTTTGAPIFTGRRLRETRY